MIGKITGNIEGFYNGCVLINVCSNNCEIGYEVFLKKGDIEKFNNGDNISLYIKEIIKEDEDTLYGFTSFEDKCWFEELIKISGLGPKTALLILSNYSIEAITEAIITNNCDFFSSISGIGNKIANRIPIEMKKNIEKINDRVISFGKFSFQSNIQKTYENKLQKINEISIFNNDLNELKNKNIKKNNKKNVENKEKNQKFVINEAIEALVSLGFSKQNIYNEIYTIVKNDFNTDDIKSENIIKQFLQKVGDKK